MAINLKDTVQIIRGKKAGIASRTGANGELNWADDTYELYIHDGKTRGGHLIGKASGTAGVVGGAGIAVSTSDGISTVSIKRDPANVLYATTDGAGVRIGTSGALQITAQNALDLRVAKGGGIIVDSNGVKIDSAVLSSVFRYAGQVNSVDDLPSDAQSGDVYDVKDSGANYVWSGTSWDNLGGIMSVDAAPTQGSTNPVASGGVYDAIQDVKLFGDGTTVTVANNIISVPEYEGATVDTAATSGLVPPAAAGEQDKVLRGDGEWGEYLQLSGGTMTGTITSTAQAALEQKDSNVSIGDTSRSSTVFKMLAVSLDKDGKRGGGVEVLYSEDGSRAIHFTMRNRMDTDWISLGLKESVDGFSAGTCPNPRDISNTNEIATTAWVRDRIAEIDFPSEVTLSDSVTSTSSTTAASSKAVKTAYDKATSAASAASAAQTTANSALGKAGMPVGSVYVQFSGQSAPSDIFGGTWSNVSSSYVGRFFRAEGGSAAAFGSNQSGGLPQHTHTVNVAWGNGGSSSTPMVRAEADNDNLAGYKTFTSGNASNSLYGAASEVRPINSTIRIWKRTA